MERGVARNLLGRLNARPPGDIFRIAERWHVPLAGTDARRHVGVLYRTMTDVRAARTFLAALDPVPAALLRAIAVSPAELRTLAEIATLTERPEAEIREAAVWLFQAGVLAREGDRQELPVGAAPRLFLPRELELVFTRVLDEIELGDIRGDSLRALLPVLDDGDIEEAAKGWGMQVIPGLHGRDHLTDELLRLMDDPDRVRRLTGTLSRDGTALWEAARDAGEGGIAFDAALGAAGLGSADTSRRDPRRADRVLAALRETERRLLVWHTYDDHGVRFLFVPPEILNPGTRPHNLPLEPLTPVPADGVTPDPPRHPHALAWDLLTVLRELASHRSPVWQPGEPITRGWQRQVNPRLWFAGESAPPDGYIGFLLSLAEEVQVIEPGERPGRSGAERNAFRPQLTARARAWRGARFSDHTTALRRAWHDHEEWIEGRERGELEVWGVRWPDVRARLLEALGTLEPGTWYRRREVARHLAGQNPGLVGSSFTVASSRGGEEPDTPEARTDRVAGIIGSELDTALTWLGLVEGGGTGSGADRIRVVRLTEAGNLAAERLDVVPGDDAALPDTDMPDGAPVLKIDAEGGITLHRPAPLHVWSLSAFSEPVTLRPVARYALSAASLGRALGAGFDLDQVTAYLQRQSGTSLPEAVASSLASWTTGYRRVRLRRMIVLQPDDRAVLDDLEAVLTGEGFATADRLPDGSGLRVWLPASDGPAAEERLLRVLRASGFAGQWQDTDRRNEGPRNERERQ